MEKELGNKKKLGNKKEFTEENELRFTLRNDYAFKKVFGNNINKEPLTEFLSLVLEIPKIDIDTKKAIFHRFYKILL